MKYVIDLPEETQWIQEIKVSKKDGHAYMDFHDVNDLTDFTAEVQKTISKAKQAGYEQAKHECEDCPKAKDCTKCEHVYSAYQRGLDDANRNGEYNADDGWYVMRKISLLPNPIKTELFGTAETAVILQGNSFKDALAKLAEYEQEKDKRARIEYNCEEIKDVINTTMKECNVSLDDIAEVLKKMQEEKDE